MQQQNFNRIASFAARLASATIVFGIALLGVLLPSGAMPINEQNQSKTQKDLKNNEVFQDKLALTESSPNVKQESEDEVSQAEQQDHEEQLKVLEDQEYIQYEKGKINFDLLRQTKLYREPPPVFPDTLAALDGKKIEMVGFMAPYDDLVDMSTFMLMPSSQGCYFCVPPSAQEVVLVRQAAEGEPPFMSAPLIVSGTLSLWEKESDDQAHEMFLYVMNEATVKEYENQE